MPAQRTPITQSDFVAVAALHNQPPSVFGPVAAVARGLNISANNEILVQQHLTTELYFVLDGEVRVNMLAASGRQITYQILGAGEMFGEVSAVDGQGRSASVAAESDCRLAVVDRHDVLQLLSTTPELALIILQRFARLSRWLTNKVYEYHTFDVKGRVYSELLRLDSMHSSETDEFEISDKDMASRVGTTRENVTRIYSALRGLSLLERTHGHVRLCNRSALEQLLAEREFS